MVHEHGITSIGRLDEAVTSLAVKPTPDGTHTSSDPFQNLPLFPILHGLAIVEDR